MLRPTAPDPSTSCHSIEWTSGFRAADWYSTTDLSRLFGFSDQKIKKEIRAGRLPGFLVPNSNHHRTTHGQIVRFLEAHPEHTAALARLRWAEKLAALAAGGAR